MPNMLQNNTNINNVNINGKKDLAFEPAVSFIIFATNVKHISVINCVLEGIKDFFLVPINSSNKINIALIVMNRLELVKDKLNPQYL